MKIFNLYNTYNIVCNWKKTRNGFKHEATLCRNGFGIYKTKICYLNRTWERFEYESILLKVVEDYFENEEKEKFLQVIKNMR